MSELKERLEGAVADLEKIITAAASVSPGVLPPVTTEFYQLFSSWPEEIRQVSMLLDVRINAFKQIGLLSNPARHCQDNTENVIFNGDSIPFWHARLICFQSYMASTWAAYDTLAQICGHLCLNEAQARDKTIKLNLTDILSKHKSSLKPEGVGFWFACQLREMYGWPIAFSYACRNWFMHEGHFHDGSMFFEGNDRLATNHRISDKVLEQITGQCEKHGTLDAQILRGVQLPNPENDFLGYLEICHHEVDDCIGLLTAWACGAAKLQASLLLKRHVVPTTPSS